MRNPSNYPHSLLILLVLLVWITAAAVADDGSLGEPNLSLRYPELEVDTNVLLLPSSAKAGSVETCHDRLVRMARSGDLAAQTELAGELASGSKRGFVKNPVEAYKWAFVATLNGHKDAEHLHAEFDLFFSVKNRQKGKALAEKYLAGRTNAPASSESQEQKEKERK